MVCRRHFLQTHPLSLLPPLLFYSCLVSQSNQESPSIFTYAPLNSSNTTRYQTPDPDPDPAEPLSQTPQPPSDIPAVAVAVVVRYRECLKNHAASMGTHVLDGCGEFMAKGEDGTPDGLNCAACECHRSFHRREVENENESQFTTRIPAIAMQPPHQHHRYNHQMPPPIMVAFGGTTTVAPESSSEELDMFRQYMMAQTSRKRFRTKITEDQKEKMHEFAEKIGWKIQKQNEQEILGFCNEVGLKRKVFKVWMHNSKQASKKKQE